LPKPQATAAGCHFGEILPQGATLMMALSVSFSRSSGRDKPTLGQEKAHIGVW
jgi:hypothetical protein